MSPPLPKRRRTGHRNWVIVIVLGVGLLAGFGSLIYLFNACRGLPYPTVGGTSLAEHNHAILEVYVKDNRVLVPYGVGEGDGGCPQPLHNHADHPEVIHIESPSLTNYTLGEYFNVWYLTPGLGDPKPVVFNQAQIFGYQVGSGNELRMFVNGQRSTDFQNLVIRQHMTIVIAYGNSTTTSWATYQNISGQPWPYSNI
jgi:hypothetical protein